MVMDTAPETKIRAIERLGASIVRATLRRVLADGRSRTAPIACPATSSIRSTTTASSPATATAGARDPRRPARRRRDRRAARRRRPARRASPRRRASSSPSTQVYAAEPETAAPLSASLAAGRPVYFDGWTRVVRRRRRRQVGARHDVAAARAAVADRLSSRSTRSRAAMKLVAERAHVIAEGAAGCAIAAALSGRAGTGKVVAVVSGGNIDLATFAALVGACEPMTPDTQILRCPFPNASPASTSSPSISGGAGTPKRARSSGASTTRCGARRRTTRCGCCGSIPRDEARGRGGRSGVPARSTTARSPRSTTRAPRATRGGRDTLPAARAASRSPTSPPSSRCISRCRSTPAASACSPAITARKPSDLGVPLIGVGFMYPQGYFHQHVSAEGWQEESYERLNWADAPIEPATDARRQAVHHGRAARRSLGARRGLARAHRPRARCTCSTPISRRTRRGTASCRRACTAAIARRASSRRSSSASAACARSRRSASNPAVFHLNEGHAGFVVLQRIRDLIEHGRDASTTRSTEIRADDDLHDAHAGAGRARRVSVSARREASRRLLGHARRRTAIASSRSASYDNGGGAAVQHDGARDALGRRDQRRQPAARRGDARDVGADVAGRRRGRAAGRRRHQRRPRADVDRRRAGRPLRAATSAPTGSSATTIPALWDGVLAIPDEELWARAPGAARATCSPSSASARGSAGRTSTSASPRVVAGGHAARARRADDRLRAPLRRLQAARARLPRPRAARAHPQRRRAAGADHLRRQGASGRRRRQAPPAARLPARARSAVRRPRRVRRRLRPARRALPRAGLRRVAEQPAQAARGERHERHEGGASTACRT